MNILSGLRFSDATFDVVYSSQFIEHLTPYEGEKVLRDIARVMKSGGILRLVTPDLEELSCTYLDLLDQLKLGPNPALKARYDWIRMEIFDQIVRDHSGGDIPGFLAACDEATRLFIIKRIGYTATTFFPSPEAEPRPLAHYRLLHKLDRIPRWLWRKLIDFFATDAVKVGRFRRSGEVHRYLYDIYSLTQLLQRAGFHSVEHLDAHRSAINDWTRYELDVVGGIIDGPLSLYVEARR